MVSASTDGVRASERRRSASASSASKRGHAHRRQMAHTTPPRRPADTRSPGRGTEPLDVVGEDQPRLHGLEDLRERRVLAREQRVGRRDRRVRHAAIHRRQRQQAVLDAVAGQDDDRAIRGQAALDERGSYRPDPRQRGSVVSRTHAPDRVAPAQERPVRCIGAAQCSSRSVNLAGYGRQRVRRPRIQNVAPPLDDRVARQDPGLVAFTGAFRTRSRVAAPGTSFRARGQLAPAAAPASSVRRTRVRTGGCGRRQRRGRLDPRRTSDRPATTGKP